MTNEAFQQLVLEKLGQLETGLDGVKSELGEVRGELSEVKSDVTGIKVELSEVKNDVTSIKTELSEIKTKLEVVYDQTAVLTEFKTDTARHFAEIKETLSFVLHKELENERDLYVLKMKQVK
ncbi:hypothetical protein [Acetobacterium sp.]|jgi:archaellum component FlaC|uniref:hypothetical protein n=1 Tax=Acetobacterium sp. TaxID=1872094 RepID=UPI000CAF0FF4|nr:hypothetical protein [Acetobacterium sp.]MDO9492915.1 hypothetical protein [Acetobacterium sp.]PKM75529.1 MAG: hypothetical protein CVU92_00875 [Firmicutes bacterium HGW-Firmicutes-17]